MKLYGELRLGNASAALKKDLKPLSMRLYQKGLISDEEFKDIITALI